VPTPTWKRRIAADASLFVVACAWGATFPLAKVILRQLPPFAYLALRFGLASVLLAPAAILARPRRRPDRWVWLTGLALAAGYAFQTLGLRTAAATSAAFITGLSVVLVPLLGIFSGRRPSPPEWFGVAAAVAGLGMLTLRPGMLPGTGEMLVLACAFCFAAQIVFLDRAAGALPPVTLGALQMASVAIVSAALMPTEPAPVRLSAPVAAAVAGMAVVASAAAFTIQGWAQRFTTPTHVGLLFASEPVAAAVFARAVLGEALAPRQWAGAALILFGILLAEARRPRAASPAPRPS
jgi:drug/metabolite transporter (DMT)-like permease